jgi:hypothetical protein
MIRRKKVILGLLNYSADNPQLGCFISQLRGLEEGQACAGHGSIVTQVVANELELTESSGSSKR